MRIALAIAIVLCLAACPSTIVVENTADIDGRADKPGVFYVLPQSKVVANIELSTSTFTPGKFAALLTDRQRQRLSLDPATPGNWNTCATDANNVEQTRYKLANVSNFVVSGVPDSDHVYYVRMKAEQFQKLAIGLEIRPDGLVGKASASSSNLSTSIVRGLAGAMFDAIESDDDTTVPPSGTAAALEVEHRRQGDIAIAELSVVERRIEELVLESRNPANVDAVLQRLEKRRTELRELFTGKVTRETRTLTLTWTPPAHSTNAQAKMCCQAVQVSRCQFNGGNETSARLNCATKACNAVDNNHLYLQLTETTTSNTIRKDLLETDYLNNLSSEERGFAYRVPAAVDAAFGIKLSGNDENLARFETYIAQFGPVFHLPANIGSASSEFTVSFHEELGALKSVSAGGVGVDSESFLTPLNNYVSDDELTRLERQYKILDYKQKIEGLQQGGDDSEIEE